MSEKKSVYFPTIDGLRFIAFSLVFFRHFSIYKPSHFLFEIGWVGVELFFLISGFLLTKLLVMEVRQNGHINVKKYFFRRILRIWPLYYLYLLFIVCLSYFFLNHPLSVGRFLGNIFFIDNWISSIEQYNQNVASFHLWSISTEEQYYLFLPFLIPWLIKRNNKTIAVVFIFVYLILLVCRYLAIQANVEHPFIYVLPISGDSFFAGILLGLGLYDQFLKKINSFFAFFCGITIIVIVFFIPGRDVIDINQLFIYLLTAVAFSLILISVLFSNNRVFLFLFSNKLIRYLGKISYGLYIFHIPVIYCIEKIFLVENPNINIRWSIVLAFALTILIASASYELFEKRFLKMKQRFKGIENRPI